MTDETDPPDEDEPYCPHCGAGDGEVCDLSVDHTTLPDPLDGATDAELDPPEPPEPQELHPLRPVAGKAAKKVKRAKAGGKVVALYEAKKPSHSLIRNARLRLDAGLLYMSDPDMTSIEQMHQHPRFAEVGLRTLERWASEDKWVERRQGFLEKWRDQAADRLGSEMVKIHQTRLHEVSDVRQMALEKLSDPMTMVKSWEGVMKVYLDASKYETELAGFIGSQLLPPEEKSAPVAGLIAPGAKFDPAEAAAAANAALEVRRRAQRAANVSGEKPAPAPAPEPEPTPVVEATTP